MYIFTNEKHLPRKGHYEGEFGRYFFNVNQVFKKMGNYSSIITMWVKF